MSRMRFTGENVLDAAQRRIRFVFDSFETVIVSVSGGKDSTVLAHLALLEAQRRGRSVGLFVLDEEVMYQSSIDQLDWLMNLMPGVSREMWLQAPFFLTNATSLTEGQLRAWEPGQHALWMRPKRATAMKAKPWDESKETHRPGYSWLDFYGVIDNFARCHPGAAFLVGLRAAGESPNRWRAVTRNPVDIAGKRIHWATRKESTVTLYPIYDWNMHDIWKYTALNGLRYSRIYDFQHKMGYPMNERRVSSLIHERSYRSLVDLPAFEPKTYARLLKRVKGVALAQEAGRSAKLFRCRKLPKNFRSWIAYRDFLLQTHPDRERVGIFEQRFARQKKNEYVARQQCRQLVLNDYENNLPIDNDDDPRDRLIAYYDEVM